MLEVNVLVMAILFIQIVAIVIHGYILVQYKKYCGHCDWWWDVGALIFFIETFIPVVGIIVCIAGPVDYIRNIAETVSANST